MDSLLLGLHAMTQWPVLVALLAGALLGIIVGATPGLEPAGAMALLLPYSLLLAPLPAIVLLFGLYSGTWYGGAIPAIIMRVPGTPVNVLTTYDGYPLARQGQTQRALALAYGASFFGGTVSVLALAVLAPHLARLAEYFGPVEFAVVALLAMVAVLLAHHRHPLAALLSLATGVFLSTIGLDKNYNTARFVFGSSDLLGGVSLIPAVIGLFSMAQGFILLAAPLTPDHKKKLLATTGQMRRAQKEKFFLSTTLRHFFGVWRYPKTLLRSIGIGLTLGLLPGVGEFGAQFLSYALAQRGSKKPDSFGKGAPEGLVASESSISACTATTLVPLLSLGVPTDPLMAMMLSVLLVHNYIPGPAIFADHPSFISGLYLSLFFVNICIVLFLLVMTKTIMGLAAINPRYIGMVVLVLSLVGSYTIGYKLSDGVVAVVFALVGWVMLKNNIPGFPLVIGLVLGPLLETNGIRALSLYHHSALVVFTRPVSTILFFMFLVGLGAYLRALGRDIKNTLWFAGPAPP